MKKHLFYPALWGVLTLSLLSSCRTEDGAITQKQVEDKRFAVLISKSGKPVNYADGFAFLMKKYDNVHGTNISGANNTKANLNASISPLFQKNSGSYVEFKVRSFVITEENGEKWVVFPRVENNQIIGLIMCTLKEKETLIAFDEIKSDSDYYKQLLPLFQEAFNRYNRRKASLLLNASIKPMAIGGEGAEPGGGGVDCGNDVQQCGYIEEVVIPGKPKEPKEPPTQPIGVSSCDSISDCPPPNYDGSGGGGGGSSTDTPPADMVMPPPPERPITDLKKYFECINPKLPANIKVYANTTGVIGHAFISIQQGYNIRTFGFYPKIGFPQNVSGPGIMGDNSTDHYDAMLNMGTASPEQLQHIIRKATEYNDQAYSLYYSNCANFTMDVMQILNPNMNESKWEKPGTVSDQIIKNGGVKQSGDGPTTHVNCN
ncbi:hypothetical protein [Elizabethkingia meningoseptica]|uniref:hypothetical protein n=1 Tax=Elizabethkingia meningoseptica TaxID=238 RepID=UPI0021A298D1|nr:hypothetical protein [Elizabethkingia meningoseptica]